MLALVCASTSGEMISSSARRMAVGSRFKGMGAAME
jgi:hypothetical protein